MQRRKFLKGSALFSGLLALSPARMLGASPAAEDKIDFKGAKNVIFLISDGMSSGTLAMADLYSRNILGRSTNWMQYYHENHVKRALMDTASASSIVTDSAAASSALGGGVRVNNGVLNIAPNGEKTLPAWKEFKSKGKKAGCVTTVTITHATPAGFCVNSASRNAEPDIALEYAANGFDVLMGGGDEFFNPAHRKDGKDVYGSYREKGYQIVRERSELKSVTKGQPLLGIFAKGALPYSIDRINGSASSQTPTLAEMTKTAIEQMKDHMEGFVLQVEAGKVDWAAHANDIAGLIHDQLAFDDALKVAMDFAQQDGQTLVIFTTDHGNANPGTIYGADVNKKFESIAKYRYTNEYLLNGIKSDHNLQQVKDWVHEVNGFGLADEEARTLLNFYTGAVKEDGLYNYKHLPYKLYAEIQKKHNAVGWISMDHSGDYVELAMYGPGSEQLKPFVKNTDVNRIMRDALAK